MNTHAFKVTGGFVFVMALSFFMDTRRVMFWFLLACAVHETAHYLSLRMFGARITAIELNVFGAEMTPAALPAISYHQEALAALSGPAANLALAIAASLGARLTGQQGLFTLAGVSLTLGLFNLIPSRHLDGGRAIYCLLIPYGEKRAERILTVLSLVSAVLVIVAGVFVLLETRYNFTLLTTGFFLFSSMLWNVEKTDKG